MYTHAGRKPLPSSQQTFYWLIIFLLPAFFVLIFDEARNPWGVYKFSLYITACYLIFRMAQATDALELVNSRLWASLLAIIGNIYAIIAISKTFALFPENHTSLFAIWSHDTRFAGPLLQPNLNGLFLNIIIATLFIQAIRSSFEKKWLLASILPCAIILASNSRSSILLLCLITIILFIFTKLKKEYLVYSLGTLAISLLIAFQWSVTSQGSSGGEIAIASRLAEGGISDRLAIWYGSIHLFFEHPTWGIGYGNLASYFAEAQAYTHINYPYLPAMHSSTYWSHNIIIQFFAEGGLIGGVSICLLFFFIAKKSLSIITAAEAIQLPYFLPALILVIISLHGMVSISIYQGFFLSLFALYLAALFPSNSQYVINKSFDLKGSFFFLPAMYFSLVFYQFIYIGSSVNAVFDDDPDSPRFIAEVSKAIDNPWTSRSGIEYLVANMEITHAPAYQWVNAYPLLHLHWQQAQNPIALRHLILYAHLSDNPMLEKYWAELYILAFTHNPWNANIIHHIQEGHLNHEPLSIR